ncbi:MmcQ/YjbR family DNA-binding protein [Coprobacter sp.]
MDIEQLREFCLSLPNTTECFPFDETTLVFKVAGKMFLYTSLEADHHWANVKCDPDLAIELREQYSYITPGYHANKKYWNTIVYDRAKDEHMRKWILHSYTEVLKKMPKAKREELFTQLGEWKNTEYDLYENKKNE